LKLNNNVWNFIVVQKTTNNLNNKTQDSEACLLCEDLLKQLQRFFDILESARKSYNSDWLTVEDIAEELKISKNVVYRLIRNGELEAVDVVDSNGRIAQRGHYRIKRSCLEKYLEDKKVKPLPGAPARTSRPIRFPKVKNHLGL
jgi:excisionase family DNA binding protein